MRRISFVMAGGKGERLWPLSTEDRPKQLIPLINGKTLLI
jgi:mannose-1-phosphate guanylyltransferase (GDP) (EC 2.7.7.22)/mannose-6-phosphate isomerase, type 2 (EC 5.3.1.8)